MSTQEELIFLIKSASEIAGSQKELASMIGAKPTHISGWKKGTRKVSPEDRAAMAAIAGFDAQAELDRATVEYWAGTPKGAILMRALGKASRATGAVLGFVGASALALFLTSPSTSHASPSEATRDNVYKRNKRYVKQRLALR